MKLTLLTIVQDMLSACDSEEVTTVSDTSEATMCVNIANRAFEHMITRYRWKHTRQIQALEASSDLNKLVADEGAYALDPNNVWYDGQRIYYCEPDEFIQLTIGRDDTQSNVTTISGFKIYNDRNPQYFTSVDDMTLVFDAYPDAVNGLDPSDSLALMYVAPTDRLTSDSEYFSLPAVAFPALEKLCLSIAVGELKGDSTLSRMYQKDYKDMMGSLATNGRFIDQPDDRRKWIVARNTRQYAYTPRISN